MLLSKTAIVKWHNKNKKHYESLGYIYTKMGDEFIVLVNHLTCGSSAIVDLSCDYCNKKFSKSYNTYLAQNQKSNINKDCCEDCISKKREESLIKTYGVKNIQQIPGVKEKTKETCLMIYGHEHHLMSEQVKKLRKQNNLEKYGVENVSQLDSVKKKKSETTFFNFGVENPFQSEKIKEKIRQRNIEQYGVEYYSQTDEFKAKFIATNLERYNVEYPTQSPLIKQRIINTNLKRFGFKYSILNPEVKSKAIQTNMIRYGYAIPSKNKDIIAKTLKSLYKNGTQKASSQQRYLCNLLNGDLNYPVDNCNLDILLEDNIYIEYQGSGHELNVKFGTCTKKEFDEKEKQRTYFLYRRGYKQIEIISRKDYLPPDEIILEMIDFAKQYLNSGHSWITFDIDNFIVKSSQFNKIYNFGTLRKIKKSNIS